jgi:hypothetical protein
MVKKCPIFVTPALRKAEERYCSAAVTLISNNR